MPKRTPGAARVATDPAAADPHLRGRAYALPFGEIWRAALALARSNPRWNVVSADPRLGEIQAEVKARLLGSVHGVAIFLSLDGNGLTRVDLVSTRARGTPMAGARRRITGYLRALDRALGHHV